MKKKNAVCFATPLGICFIDRSKIVYVRDNDSEKYPTRICFIGGDENAIVVEDKITDVLDVLGIDHLL